MNKLYYIFFFVVYTSCLFGQSFQKTVDSLKLELSKAQNDSVKLHYLNALGYQYQGSSMEYSQKALELAKKTNNPVAMADSYTNIGLYYEVKKDTIKHLESINKIMQLGIKEKNEDILGKAFYEKAFYYYNRNTAKTIENFLKSETLFTETNNKKNLAQTIMQLGGYYQEHAKDYNKALEYYRKLNTLLENDYATQFDTNFLIAQIYEQQSKYKESLEYFQLSEKIYSEQSTEGYNFDYNYLLFSIASTYKHLNDYEKSLIYYDLALEKFLNENSHYFVSLIYIGKAAVYNQLEEEESVTKNIALAWKAFEKIKLCNFREYFYITMASLYYDKENYVDALASYLNAYGECKSNDAFKEYEKLEYRIGMTYLKLSQNIDQIKKEKPELPKNKSKLLLLADKYLNTSIQRAENKGSILRLKDAYLALSEIAELQNHKTKAFGYYKQHIIYKDSLATIENRELLVQNQMQFEFDQQKKIRLAEQETKDAIIREELAKEKNRRNMALAGVGIFVVLAGFAGFAYAQKRKDNKLIAQEKQKSDDLLLNILPEEVANELKENGTSEARHFESVSIMFTDFKDFTKLSEKIPSKELIEELNYCFKAFDEIIVKHGIEKIKTIGDSYMAVCGLPAKQGNHAHKMVEAALEIRDFIENYKEKRQKEGKSFFEMRIGINSGEVVAGIVGIKKFAYDIWGDAVNTASRMESNGAIGKVNISESTYNLIKNDFDFEHRGEIDTKGKGKINMYFVEHKQQTVMRFEKAKSFILKKLDNELPKHLSYHNLEHILDVYEATVQYCTLEKITAEDTELLKLASLFHDSGFIVQADGHEQISCKFAEKHLPDFGYNNDQIEKIKGMIMATKIPQSPKNHLEQILADADLDYLGRDDFEGISNKLFEELKANNQALDIDTWNQIQISFFEKHSYFTDSAKQLRENKKMQNLKNIKDKTQL